MGGFQHTSTVDVSHGPKYFPNQYFILSHYMLSLWWMNFLTGLGKMSTPSNKLAAASQEKIGLTNTLLGERSPQCTRLQQLHYQRKVSWCIGNKWLCGLIKVTFSEAHGLWMDRNKNLREARGVDMTELTAIDIMVTDKHQQGLHYLLAHRFPLFQ